MPWLSLSIAVVAAITVALPAPGVFVAMGLAIVAIGTGIIGFRRRGEAGPRRLAAAGAVTLGLIALVLAAVRYGVTLAVVDRLERLIT